MSSLKSHLTLQDVPRKVYLFVFAVGFFNLGILTSNILQSDVVVSAEFASTGAIAVAFICLGSSHLLVAPESTASRVLSAASIAFAVAGLVAVFFIAP